MAAIFSPTSVSRDKKSRPLFDETSRDHEARIFFLLYLYYFKFSILEKQSGFDQQMQPDEIYLRSITILKKD